LSYIYKTEQFLVTVLVGLSHRRQRNNSMGILQKSGPQMRVVVE